MSNPPTGTITFLLTDIEGSTKRWEHDPEGMRRASARHDAVLHECIEANGGYTYKRIGDAFQAAFSTAREALQAAIDAQRALALYAEPGSPLTGPLWVRMALHTGVTEERVGDYVGPLLNRAARLMSAGHGGQTLVSQATQDLLLDVLPEGVALRDLGEHRLKDLLRPEHIFQVIAPGLPSEFPPLKTLDNHPNNLPRQTTTFIGREQEVHTLAALVREPGVALVTLTGAGGSGKTRLALQVAADLLEDFPDGVWFVELAPITEPKLVVSAISQTLGVKEVAGRPLIGTLKGYLKEKQLLLQFDNFEQVAEAAHVVSELLAACTGVKALVTSRAPLRIRGEKEYAVSPLGRPDPHHLPPAGPGLVTALSRYEAVRLFVERATDVKADFELTEDNAFAIAEICVRLDGLPLAIELAAARIRLFPPQALLSRLDSRLKVLTGGAKDLPARQQTLRNTIEWSYDLLSEGEKQLFRRMAAFQGGATLEELEAVCNSEALQIEGALQVGVLEGVEALVSQSLLQLREGKDGEPRFWMLETIHEYAWEKLQERGQEETEALLREHALYFMALAEEAEPQWTSTTPERWLERLEEEHDNLRAALRWARAEGGSGESAGEDLDNRGDRAGGDVVATDVGLRIAGALWRFWELRSYLSEGREQLAGVLALSTLPTSSGMEAPPSEVPSQSQSRLSFRAKALNGAGNLAWLQGDYAAARSLHEESLAIRRELEDKGGIASSLNNLGLRRYDQGDYAAARSLHEESLAISRELEDRWGIATSLNNLGLVAYSQGDYTVARSLHEESLAIGRELGNKIRIAGSLNNLGLVAYSQGDYAAARSLFEESLAIKRELGNKWGIVSSLVGLAGVAVGLGQGQSQEQGKRQTERGTRLLGAVEALREAMGVVLDTEDRIPHEQATASARIQLSAEEFERAMQEGRAMSIEQAIEYALDRTPWP